MLRSAVNGARRISPPAKWATVASLGFRPPPAEEFGFLRFNPQSAIRTAFSHPPPHSYSIAFYTPHSALRTRNSCPCLTLRPQVSPCFLFPVPRSLFPAFGSYPQRRVPKSPCQKPSNSGQNRSKRRRFPLKSDQKGAHFVMPILTFWGVTPSGASARAVLPLRKGKKGAFRRRKMPSGKVINR